MTVSRSSARRVAPDLVAQLGDEPLGLGPRGPDRLVPLAPGAPALLLGRRSASTARSLGRPGPLERLGRLALGSRIDASVASNVRCVSVSRERASATIAVRQPEPLGDRERLAAAGQADRQPVGRAERLEVELDRRVAAPPASCGRRP